MEYRDGDNERPKGIRDLGNESLDSLNARAGVGLIHQLNEGAKNRIINIETTRDFNPPKR